MSSRPGLGPGPLLAGFSTAAIASDSRGKRKTGGGSQSFPTFLRHQLFKSSWREIDACAKRDNHPRSMCPNPCSQGGGQPKKCRPEQACATPGILGFIPVTLGCGEYFRFPGSLLEVNSREGEGLFLSFSFSFPPLLLLVALRGDMLVQMQ